MAEAESWHLSKSVPVSIIIVLVLQFTGGIFMVAQMDSTIKMNMESSNRNARRITSLDSRIGEVRDRVSLQAVQVGKIGTSLDNIEKQLDQISRLLRTQGSR